MQFGGIQLHSGEKHLLKQVAVVEAVVRENSSIKRGIIRPVISSLRTVDPHRGPIEGERSGGTVHRRQRKCSVVVVPNDPDQKPPNKKNEGEVERECITKCGREEKVGWDWNYSRLPEGIRRLSVTPCSRGRVVDQRTDIVQRHVHPLNHRRGRTARW